MILLTTIWIMLFTLRGRSRLLGKCRHAVLDGHGTQPLHAGASRQDFWWEKIGATRTRGFHARCRRGEASAASGFGLAVVFDFAVLQLPEGLAITESGSQWRSSKVALLLDRKIQDWTDDE